MYIPENTITVALSLLGFAVTQSGLEADEWGTPCMLSFSAEFGRRQCKYRSDARHTSADDPRFRNMGVLHRTLSHHTPNGQTWDLH